MRSARNYYSVEKLLPFKITELLKRQRNISSLV